MMLLTLPSLLEEEAQAYVRVELKHKLAKITGEQLKV